MSDIAIKVENLSKRYRIGLKEELPDTFVGAATNFLRTPFQNLRQLRRLTRFTGNGDDPEDVIWALRDVSFEVERGEVVGIIGRNGAGKSTLLKILSRITHPTSGRVELNGRVSSLLEVGTGFHSELTGRENIYLNGTILGMTKAEVDRKFDEIVAFSGVEKFIDTPVKRYSSGMRVRLAFSVAAHLDPEILLIDEVLAVGDAGFQKKCLGKMGEVAGEGRTVLFVSHNMIALQSLCERAVWLNEGELVEDGYSQDVVADYLKLQAKKVHERVWYEPESAPGNEIARLHRLWVKSKGNSNNAELLARENSVYIGVEYWQLDSNVEIHIALHVYVEQQVVAFTTGSSQDNHWHKFSNCKGLKRSVCKIPANFLNTGQHRIMVLVVKDRSRVIYKLEDALSFEIVETSPRAAWFGKEPGVLRPSLDWKTKLLEERIVE